MAYHLKFFMWPAQHNHKWYFCSILVLALLKIIKPALQNANDSINANVCVVVLLNTSLNLNQGQAGSDQRKLRVCCCSFSSIDDFGGLFFTYTEHGGKRVGKSNSSVVFFPTIIGYGSSCREGVTLPYNTAGKIMQSLDYF